MKTDLSTQFNLPKYTKGKSFADASKAIEAKFKGRNDKASIETKQELLERLSQAQEYLKQQSQAEANNKMALGGFEDSTFGKGLQEGATGEEVSGSIGAGLGALTTGLDLAKGAFGPTGIDTSGATEAPDVQTRGGSALGGAMKGAAAGASFGPWGAAIGGVVGGAAGLLKGGKENRAAEKAEYNNDLMKANNFRPSNFALGGYTDPTHPKKEIKNLTPEERAALDAKLKSQSLTEGVFSNNAATYDPRGDGGIFAKVGYNKQTHPNLDLGKYKDVNYFNPQLSEDGRYTLNNTKDNPANADLYKKQLSYIQGLNPKANIATNNDSGFKPLINQQAMGGYQNKYVNGGKPTIEQNQEGLYVDADKLGLNAAGFEAYQKANPMGTYEQPINQPINQPYGISGFGQKNRYNTGVDLINRNNAKEDLLALNSNIIDKNKTNQYIQNNQPPKNNNILDKAGNFLKENYGNILSYTPLLGNLTNKLEKPVTERGTRLDNTYQPQLFDEQSLINQVNQNNVNKGLTESSGGDLGALRTNLLASNLNKTKAVSDAYMKGEQINRGEKQFQFQSGMNRDQFNAQLNESYIDRKARDEGAYNTAKSAQRAAIFEDIGSIGKEESYKKIVKEMFGYKWNGKYFVDKEGKKVEQSTIDAKLKDKK